MNVTNVPPPPTSMKPIAKVPRPFRSVSCGVTGVQNSFKSAVLCGILATTAVASLREPALHTQAASAELCISSCKKSWKNMKKHQFMQNIMQKIMKNQFMQKIISSCEHFGWIPRQKRQCCKLNKQPQQFCVSQTANENVKRSWTEALTKCGLVELVATKAWNSRPWPGPFQGPGGLTNTRTTIQNECSHLRWYSCIITAWTVSGLKFVWLYLQAVLIVFLGPSSTTCPWPGPRIDSHGGRNLGSCATTSHSLSQNTEKYQPISYKRMNLIQESSNEANSKQRTREDSNLQTSPQTHMHTVPGSADDAAPIGQLVLCNARGLNLQKTFIVMRCHVISWLIFAAVWIFTTMCFATQFVTRCENNWLTDRWGLPII